MRMTLSKILSATGKTQTAIAEKVGVFQTTVGGWIRGTSLPPSTRLPFLAAFLGMPVDDLRALVAKDRRARSKGLGRVGRGGVRSHARKHSAGRP
jgi:transcriptional regulator with XRE-family HTH domain